MKWYREMGKFDRRTFWTAVISILVLVLWVAGSTYYLATHPERTTVTITIKP